MGNDLLVIGGISNWNSQSAIYSFRCTNSSCSWKTVANQLSEPRYNALTMPIPNVLAHCDKRNHTANDE